MKALKLPWFDLFTANLLLLCPHCSAQLGTWGVISSQGVII